MRIKIALTDDIDTCLDLRRVVFIDEQDVPEEDEIDGADQDAWHILASVNDLPAGTARILRKGTTAKIGRVCVLLEQRGTGLGAGIMRKALEVCKTDIGAKKAILGSQTHAISFYEKLGFTAYGPIYLDAGVEHRDMEIAL
jgi:predicted GNAT family N-acyltransferase